MTAKQQQLINELNRFANSILDGKSDIATIEHRIHQDRIKGREVLFELMLIMPHRNYLRMIENG